ncbi:MAG: hypothetical protein Q8R76_04065 [Candidatus Omnitrophota bacterium]|nr:hypothetical protein [Candidatus Omnitrophota bacterium]
MKSSDLIIPLVGWFVGVSVVVWHLWKRRTPSVGLPFAYLFDLTMIHWFGALIYALPWYFESGEFAQDGVRAIDVVRGFNVSCLGVLAFAFGVVVIGPLLLKRSRIRTLPATRGGFNRRLPTVYLFVAIFFNFVLGPFIRRIPTIGTMAQSGWTLLIAALCLMCWQAHLDTNKKKLLVILLFTILFLPVTTLLAGFLGYGVRAASIVFLFVFIFYRPRYHLVLGAIFSLYLGLSFFVNYMDVRTDIRKAAWGQSSRMGVLGTMGGMVSNFKMLDLHDEDQLEDIDRRLNQNILVGASVDYLESGQIEYASGKTFRDALIAMVPRIIWRNKPVVAGSGDLVATYTGMVFGEGTSVGVGQVMEFYINYGNTGVIMGFLILGSTIAYFDRKAAEDLKNDNWTGFTYWFVPGVGFLQSIGSLVEITATVLSAVVFCLMINWFVMTRMAGARRSAR